MVVTFVCYVEQEFRKNMLDMQGCVEPPIEMTQTDTFINPETQAVCTPLSFSVFMMMLMILLCKLWRLNRANCYCKYKEH